MIRQSSRMQRLEERRNLRRAVVFTFGTVVILAALATLGFNLLTKLFVFFGNLKSPGTATSDKTDFIPPGPPQLAIPFEATNSAIFSIKGIAEPGATIYLSQNDNEVTNEKVPEEGIFEFDNITLKEGTNIFTAVAVDDAGNRSQISSRVAVDYSAKLPALDISSPSDRQSFSKQDSRITIKGKTDPGARVTINDRVTIVNSDGSFSLQLGLNAGDNPLVIIATNSAGNQTRKEISVNYTPG